VDAAGRIVDQRHEPATALNKPCRFDDRVGAGILDTKLAGHQVEGTRIEGNGRCIGHHAPHTGKPVANIGDGGRRDIEAADTVFVRLEDSQGLFDQRPVAGGNIEQRHMPVIPFRRLEDFLPEGVDQRMGYAAGRVGAHVAGTLPIGIPAL
jgi:hypothetical protein